MLKNQTTWINIPCNDWETVDKMTKIQPSTVSLDTVEEVMEISHKNFPPMPGKSAFMFHHNFYSKPKLNLKRFCNIPRD